MKHEGRPLWLVKREIIRKFADWCTERKADKTNENLIEFLMQKGFIQGKKWLDNIDKMPHATFQERLEERWRYPLREGFYIQYITEGHRK